MFANKLSRFFQPNVIILLIMVIGGSLRINVYLQNRSFIIDEANLARNIVEKNYVDFFKPLDYEQYSPPLFSCALKTLTNGFGVNEYSLTIISLLAGIGSLFLFWFFASKLDIEGVPLFYSLLLLSFSTLAIRYSTELKQYSLDAFLCLLFIYWTIKRKEKEFTLSYGLALALSGSVAIWTSMPIVFVLASIGMMLLYRSVILKEIRFSYLILIGATWLTSFGVYYFNILQADAGSDYLQNFHSNYFFDFLPTSKGTLLSDFHLLRGLFKSVMDKTAIPLIGGFVFFTIGGIELFKKMKFEAGMLLLPILFCLIASHFNLYSLLERLTLFLIPLMLLVFAYGFSSVWNKSNSKFKIVLCAFALLTLINKKGYEHFWSPLQIEDAKTTMDYLGLNRTDDQLIFVHHDGVPAFCFYNDLYDDAKGFTNFHLGKWDERIGSQSLNPGDVFWLYFTHTKPVDKLQKDFTSAEGIATKIDEYNSVQAILQKYRVNE